MVEAILPDCAINYRQKQDATECDRYSEQYLRGIEKRLDLLS